jgi:hypothetical protein
VSIFDSFLVRKLETSILMRNVEAQSYHFFKTPRENYDSNINNKHSLTLHSLQQFQKDKKEFLKIKISFLCDPFDLK